MNEFYKSYFNNSGSEVVTNSDLAFSEFAFFSEIGKGTTRIHQIGEFGSICFVNHEYFKDFEYNVSGERSVIVSQFETEFSRIPNGIRNVTAGSQWIESVEEDTLRRFTVIRDVKAIMMGIQILPKYYEEYLPETSGADMVDFAAQISTLSKKIHIPEVSLIFDQIRRFQGEGHELNLYYRCKFEEMAAVLMSAASREKEKKRRISLHDKEALNYILDYIDSNLDKKLNLQNLADMAYMSPAKLKYVFSAVTGNMFSVYLRTKRIEKACFLLTNTNEHINRIALAIGYANPSSFTVEFKKVKRMLPSEYRLEEDILCTKI